MSVLKLLRFEGLQFSCEFYLLSCQVRDYLNTVFYDLFSDYLFSDLALHFLREAAYFLWTAVFSVKQINLKFIGFFCLFGFLQGVQNLYMLCIPGNGEMKLHNTSTWKALPLSIDTLL